MSNFSRRFKELRIEKGASQGEIATALHVSRSTIGNYEQGTREPNHEKLEEIADYFNVDIDYLIGRKDWTTNVKTKNELSYDFSTNTWEEKEIIKPIIITDVSHSMTSTLPTITVNLKNIKKKEKTVHLGAGTIKRNRRTSFYVSGVDPKISHAELTEFKTVIAKLLRNRAAFHQVFNYAKFIVDQNNNVNEPIKN